MSIYNINGNPVSILYGADGRSIENAYDIEGVEVFSAKYKIGNVASYFRESTLSVSAELNALSDEWHSFIFITDPHGYGNKNHSQAIGLYLLDNAPVDFLALGGDYFAGAYSEDEYNSYMAQLLNSKKMGNIYAILGNHDAGWQSFDPQQCEQAIYDDFLKDKLNVHGNLTENYYYYDDVDSKVRYMFINTSCTAIYKVGDTQISWITQNVVLPDSTWSLWVIGHVPLNRLGGLLSVSEPENDGGAVVSAILNCNGSIIGYLCGHEHIDYQYYDGDLYHTTLQCDRFENRNYYDGISVIDRVAGTVSEQAVTVVSFNTKTRNVVFRRIGCTRNAVLNYSY